MNHALRMKIFDAHRNFKQLARVNRRFDAVFELRKTYVFGNSISPVAFHVVANSSVPHPRGNHTEMVWECEHIDAKKR
jgi:hypothetical protein